MLEPEKKFIYWDNKERGWGIDHIFQSPNQNGVKIFRDYPKKERTKF